MKLIDLITENYSFAFSGRIQILDKSTRQYLGSIYQNEGVIINAGFGKLEGKKALASILMKIRAGDDFHFVPEPEIISNIHVAFELSEGQFFEFKRDYFEEYDKLSRLKPSEKLQFRLNTKALTVFSGLNHQEFTVVKSIIRDKTVSKIYENTPLLDFDVTKSLVSLRKKGIILVYAIDNGETHEITGS